MDAQPQKHQSISDAEILEIVQDDIIVLLGSQPFYAYMMVKTKRVVDRSVPVAGVSIRAGTAHLHINPEGYLSYTKMERLFILIHEIMHVIFLHFLRQKHRDHSLWNVATDIAINQLIETEKCSPPHDCLQPAHYQLPPKKDAEFYYKTLWERKIKIEVPKDLLDGAFADSLGPSDESSNLRAPSFENIHATWNDSDAENDDEAQNTVRSLVQDAYNKAKALEGGVSSDVELLVSQLFVSKTNWRSVFRNFVASKRSVQKKATWKKRNRRLGSAVMGFQKSKSLRLVVAVDDSSSIPDHILTLFNSEIERIHQTGADIVVVICDAKVKEVFAYNKKMNITFKGRGSTDFRPVFDAVIEAKHPLLRRRPDAVVYLTDGLGKAPDRFPLPTLWCLTPNGVKPRDSKYLNEISWGMFIRLEENK